MKKGALFITYTTLFSLLFCGFLIALDQEPVFKLGKVTYDEIIKVNPDWKENAVKYMPAPESIDYLARVYLPVNIEVYYGHWCEDSQSNLPKFFQILEIAANSAIEVEYWSMPKSKAGKDRKPMNKRKIVRIPTFVVFIEGIEAGEIVENPEVSIESDLVNILKKVIKEE